MNRTLTAALLAAAAVLTQRRVHALGTVFNYPDVLKEPVEDVRAAFRGSQGAVTAWFTVLAVSAAPLRADRRRRGPALGPPRDAAGGPVGIAAAVVQVIGLSRWPLLVPGYAADAASADPVVAAAARDSFMTAHRILGNLVGETFGYILTAAWTHRHHDRAGTVRHGGLTNMSTSSVRP